MEPFVLIAVADLPRLGIRAGDRVVWEPTDSPYPSLCRDLRNTGAVLLAWELGALQPVTRTPLPADLRAAVGETQVRRAPSLRAVSHARLRLVP